MQGFTLVNSLLNRRPQRKVGSLNHPDFSCGRAICVAGDILLAKPVEQTTDKKDK
jgi:hypothetical protein